MTYRPNNQLAPLANPGRDPAAWHLVCSHPHAIGSQVDRNRAERCNRIPENPPCILSGALRATVAASLLVTCGAVVADGDDSAAQLRHFIGQQVGGIDKLQVPANDAAIPVPRQQDGNVSYRYQTTEAKRYLGKLLFHDPVRTARININEGQPVDLPAGTAFGGTVSASDPNVPAIVDATRQTGSCGSCHFGEAATKAGQQINFSVGGEGRGYTDRNGNFFPRRRAQSILTKQRSTPLFAGDTLVDALPTLTDIDIIFSDTPEDQCKIDNPPAAGRARADQITQKTTTNTDS